MTNDAVLDQTYLKYGIIVPKRTIIQIIESMPEFQRDGVFDSKIYSTVLYRSGVHESEFAKNIKDNISRSQLLHPLMSGIRIPKFVMDIITQDFNTQKTLVLGHVKLDDIKITENISEDSIVEYYNSNKETYKRPETRDVSILVIDYSKLAGDIKITQSEIDEYYSQSKEAFAPKEFRSFDRLSFQNAEHADKAWAMMKKEGASVREVVVKLTPTIDNIDEMERHSFPKEVGDNLFNLKKNGEASNVYKIGGRYYIYVLKNISRHEEKKKSEIDNEIREILKNEKTSTPEFYERIREMRHKIDDGIGSGKRIQDIANETGMNVVTIQKIVRDVTSEDIKKLASDKGTIDNINEAIFSTEEGGDSPNVDSLETDTLSFVIHVDKVTKSYYPELKEISDTVKNDLIKSRKDEIARKKVHGITEKYGSSVQELLKLKGIKTYEVSKKEILMSQQKMSKNVEAISKDIPNLNIVLDIVSTLKKGNSKYFTLPNGDYLIVGVKDVKKSDSDDVRFSDIINKYINDGAKNDFSEISMQAFKNCLEVKIDNKTLDRITRLADNEDEKE
jgi:peptidyl-prolyl cis-trans isomerase D